MTQLDCWCRWMQTGATEMGAGMILVIQILSSHHGIPADTNGKRNGESTKT